MYFMSNFRSKNTTKKLLDFRDLMDVIENDNMFLAT